jgi:Peptidase family M23
MTRNDTNKHSSPDITRVADGRFPNTSPGVVRTGEGATPKEQNKPGIATGVFASPVKNPGVSSGYGWRIQPAGKKKGQRKFHRGLDIAKPEGTEQVAPDGGVVTYAGPAGNAGNVVVIDHRNGTVSRLFHMGEIIVKKNQEVSKGQPIGTVGSTGDSTGPHVHWEVLRGKTEGTLTGYGDEFKDNHMNPKPFLTNGKYTKSTDKASKETSSTIAEQNEEKTYVVLNNTDGSPTSLSNLYENLYRSAEEVSQGSDRKLREVLGKYGDNGVAAYAANHPSLKNIPASEKFQEAAKAFAPQQVALS